MPAVFTALLDEVRSTIVGLALAGIDSEQIQIRKQPWHRELSLPGVLLTPIGELLPREGGTNASNEIGYGIRITLVQAGNQSLAANLDRLLLWREAIVRAFHLRRLANVAESVLCRIEPGAVVESLAADRQYDVSVLVVRCFSREPRS